MAPAHVMAVVVVVVFAGVSFFFSLAETSLFSLSKWQLQQLEQRDPKRAGSVARLLSEPQDLLATIALGNTFAGAAMLVTALWMVMNAAWPSAITLAALLVLILFFCEVLPKTLAVRHPEPWSLRIAPMLVLVLLFSRPLCRFAQKINLTILGRLIPIHFKAQPKVTEADYQELLEMAYQQGTLAQSEKETILQIISLDRRTAREVMKPRSQMAVISDDLSIEDMIAAARRYKHRRLPIYDETPDTIVGILNTKALLLDPAIDLADAIEFPSFVPESMNLLQLLKSLQRQPRGMAIVLDEFGGTAGIVTLEDILEEIVGKIRAEIVSDSFVMEKLASGRWRVSGLLRLDDFRREYPAVGDVPDVETMGGLLMSLLEVVPKPGDSINFRGLKLTAQLTDERRVKELLVERTK
jgi:CBS domain containing-hemolysin-like protein